MELLQANRVGNNLPTDFNINVTKSEIELINLGLESYVNRITNSENSTPEERETSRLCWNLREQFAVIYNTL